MTRVMVASYPFDALRSSAHPILLPPSAHPMLPKACHASRDILYYPGSTIGCAEERSASYIGCAEERSASYKQFSRTWIQAAGFLSKRTWNSEKPLA